jgi:FixJ family two-component response regulator
MSENLPKSDIFIVDDDRSVLDALSAVFALQGYKVSGFSEGPSFLAAARVSRPSCVILDVKMPGLSGLDILKELDAEAYGAPIFMISGQGDIPMAVDAIKLGALDFIQKPFDADTLLSRVREGTAAWRRRRDGSEEGYPRLRNFAGRDLLTPRECEVLALIAGGLSNKEAGRELGISPRTIEVHRARIMDKLGAKNAADLVRIVLSESRGH